MIKHAMALVAGLLTVVQVVCAAQFNDIERYASITTPVGKGPFPVVFLIPGCGGFSASYSEAQNGWAKRGMMSIRIDLQSAGGVPSCRELSIDDAISDVMNAIGHLRRMPAIKPGALNIMGISWGGAVAMAAVSKGLKADAMVLLFPACKFTRHLSKSALAELPVLVIHGEDDKVAPMAACKEKFAAFPNLELLTFPDAPHSFIGKPGFPTETKKARKAYWNYFRR